MRATGGQVSPEISRRDVSDRVRGTGDARRRTASVTKERGFRRALFVQFYSDGLVDEPIRLHVNARRLHMVESRDHPRRLMRCSCRIVVEINPRAPCAIGVDA